MAQLIRQFANMIELESKYQVVLHVNDFRIP